MVIAHRHIQGDTQQMEHSCNDGLGTEVQRLYFTMDVLCSICC